MKPKDYKRLIRENVGPPEVDRMIVALMQQDYSTIFYRELEGYLEEKGIDYVLDQLAFSYSVAGYSKNTPSTRGAADIVIRDVPVRLWDEVVMPGIRDICERFRAWDMRPGRQVSRNCCTWSARLMLQWDRIRKEDLERVCERI